MCFEWSQEVFKILVFLKSFFLNFLNKIKLNAKDIKSKIENKQIKPELK